MNHPLAAPQTPDATSLRLTSRSDLPPRVVKILRRLLSIGIGAMGRSLSAMLDEFELQLVRMADKALNNEQENEFFDTLNIVKRHRAEFASRFLHSLESTMTRFDQAEPFRKTSLPTPVRPRFSMELLGEGDLQNVIVLDDVAAKAALRCSHELFALGYRFGVLAGSPRIDAELLPVGPAALAEALRVAAEPLNLTIEHRSLLYRAFERLVLSDINAYYQVLNRELIEQGVLPYLHAPTMAIAATGPVVVAMPSRSGTASAPAQPASETVVARAALRSVPQAPAKDVVQEERTAESFQSLRKVLKRRRLRDVKWVSRTELHDILIKLQSTTPSHAELHLLGHGDAERIQLDELTHASPRLHLKLTEEDNDILDLVGLVFEQMSLDAVVGGAERAMLLKLHVPFARIALDDQDFFLRRAHPARLLLNGIVAAYRYGIDEVEGEVEIAWSEQLRVTTERIAQEYDGNLALIEELWLDLSKSIVTQTRKSEATERRQVAAACGRAKLTLATQRARDAITARLALRKPNKMLRTLFDRAWVDVLALTLLRNTEDSIPYRRRLAVVEALLALDAADRTEQSLTGDDLRREIEGGLEQIGYHRDDIPELVQKFFLQDVAGLDENPSTQTELAIKLKNRARLGTEATGGVVETFLIPSEAEATDLEPVEEAALEKLVQLPEGTWLEFAHGVHGSKVRRRLWNLAGTGSCLLTNLRGVIVAQRSLNQLARAMVHGDVRITDAAEEAPAEYAWAKILEALSPGS